MDKPISQQFLQVENNGTVTGTTPRDSETRPHVQASVDDSALDGQSNPDAKPMGIIGPSLDGIPNHVYKISSIQQAKHVFGGGPLLTGIELAWQPSGIAYGNGGVIYAERVQNATQATLNAGALHFISTSYGKNANDDEISLRQDPLEDNTWDLGIRNKREGYSHTYHGLGLLAHLQYVPNSWDKFHIPDGEHDYARATIEIVPNIQKKTYPNGSSSELTTGAASKLVFHIHDTKHQAIFHNNATNNYTGGSTVYTVDDPNFKDDKQTPYVADNPGYYADTPLEYQSNEPASAGDLNPDRGPFVDKEFSVDLTNPKFTNMNNLLAYLQQLNFGDQAHLEISANEDARLSHIPPYLLDLDEHPQSIMANLDGTTEDKKGNIIEPGSLRSVLGSIIDVLRYNPRINASAQLKKQLNFIPTIPQGDDYYTSLASNYSKNATAASLSASYDYSEASVAKGDNVPSLAGEYVKVGDSYANAAQKYVNLANSANDTFWDNINASTYGSTSADSVAATTAKSANTTITSDSKNVKSLAHSAVHASQAANQSNTRASHLMDTYNKDVANNKSALNSANTDLANAKKANANQTTINSLTNKISSLNNNKFSSSAANTQAQNASQHKAVYNKLMGDIHALQAKDAKAKKAATEAARKARESDDKVRKHNSPVAKKNMQYVQNYIINLVKQLQNFLFDSTIKDSNVTNSDLDALTRVVQYMEHPKNPVDSSIIKMGDKAAEPLMKLTDDLKDYRAGIKGSKNALQLDLAYIQADIEQAKSQTPAPKDILPNAYGDGVINILGESIYAFDYTNLSGGTTGQIPIDWSDKFKYFNDTPVYDFVVLSPRASVHANLAAYIGDRYEANHNMRGFVGAGKDASAQELIDRSSTLDNERICLYGTSGDLTIDDGIHEDVPAYLGAALIAGIDSSLKPGQTILNKKVNYNRIDQDFSSSELDALNANGVITANPVVNRGVTSEYTISNDVTTNNDSSDPIKAQLSLGEVTDYLFDEIRGFLQKDIGRVVTAGSSDQIVTDVNAFLHDHCSKYNGGEGLIVDYKGDDTFCEIRNESAYITFNVAPSMPLKFISVVGRYSGFDEQSGDGSASFQFLGTDGSTSEDDDDLNDSSDDGEDADNLIDGSSI